MYCQVTIKPDMSLGQVWFTRMVVVLLYDSDQMHINGGKPVKYRKQSKHALHKYRQSHTYVSTVHVLYLIH